jgi:gliding motility-associated-like protein
VTTPSTCVDATGTISLVLTEPIQIVDIEWTTPVGYASGFYVINQPPGDYEVKITDANGCIYRKTATIASNIHTFNGVSPNGDNKNDKFVISCIENFERRTVRIYNRAGTLVYENRNYDNQTSYFEGFGNRGLYIGGDKLPDGTYFYIIDKHDGKEPVSGYLELLR